MPPEVDTNATENSTTEATQAVSTDQSSSTTEAQTTETSKDEAKPDEKSGSTILTDAGAADTSAEGDTAKGDEPPANPLLGAPEGDYELALPEGVTVDTEALGFVAPIAKEIGLSNEGMNKLAGVYAEQVLPHVAQTIVKQMENDVAEQRREWDAQTRLAIAGGKDKDGNDVAPDPDFNGAKLEDVVAASHKAIRKLGGEDFAKFLEDTGLGNDPRMVKFAYRVGTALSEDTTFERGSGAASRPKTLGEALYGSS